ncbi:lipocalin-like domain-containing protein [Limosilactobacillus sp.]|jgi:hypothetical protein|uniref:lipocalin-like domain-containing protein n=1 Tax=Limosilactobacillus sp. TaxID=2773925 RepID=UPI0025C12D9E|nr:lipocalin-like domain-containing protein [Limosilactobacillus sp.]MCH3922841.1 hypothetical protein [Limosilactobacillus sp.]MCH3927524.1 hypothetical protein [Limosilactobacillus sp.]
MAQARLMKTAADYQRLGLKKGQVELWEDGKRDDVRKGGVEWWYFDAIFDDGSKIAAAYSTKVQPLVNATGTHPCLRFDITTPDGEKLSRRITKFPKDSVRFSKDKCDLQWGESCFTGNLHDYHIKAQETDGLGFDIQLHSISSPWRGETGYLGFEENDQKYFTWLCVVPRGTVTGTLTINGKTTKVTGFGYHDHQWGNIIHFDFLNHWFWSRQSTAKHSLVVFDFVMNQHYEYERIPLVFLEDNDGKVIFESTDNVECSVSEELLQKASDTKFPKVIHYKFRNGTKTVHYDVTVKQELDARYIWKETPFFMRRLFHGTKPRYGRYLAAGVITFEDSAHPDQNFKEQSDFIYEFSYVGPHYKEQMETKQAKAGE